MTSERTASGPRVRHVLTGAFHDFGRAWRELLATDVLYKVLAFGILTPLVGIALRAFVSTSGNSVLADTDILLFFLSPVGLLALVVLSALSLAIVALEQACLMTVHANLATPHFIRRAHRQGKEVFVWTINDPSQMSRMISRGVDSLITDQPALGRAVIQERAEMNVVERLLLELSLWLGAESSQPGPETDAG